MRISRTRLLARPFVQDQNRLTIILGDVPAATAILDPFLQHTEVIGITGRSYRPKNQAAQSKGKEEACKKGKK